MATFRIGLTGGIGSGKSYVCGLLAERGIRVYDCDAAAKRLLRTSSRLQKELSLLIGEPVMTDGTLNKSVLSKYLLASEANQSKLNRVIHPAVIEDFLSSDYRWMESAILFESGYAHVVDYIVCVTCPDVIRIERICRRDGITPEMARQWMARQWPQEHVVKNTQFEIVNDGKADLSVQIDALLKDIQECSRRMKGM